MSTRKLLCSLLPLAFALAGCLGAGGSTDPEEGSVEQDALSPPVLSATVVSSSQINLSWTAVATAQ